MDDVDNAVLKHYEHVMGVIDKYMAEEKGKNVGPLLFLREDLGVRTFTTTPTFKNCDATLKTYLAKNILECYPCSAKYVKHKNIYENLAETAKKDKKGYIINECCIKKCFNVDENIALVNDASMLLHGKDDDEFLKNILLHDENLSLLLISMIQKDVEKHLYKYWKLCEDETKNELTNSESENNAVSEKKKAVYLQIVNGMALHEIFFKDMLEDKFNEKKEAAINGKCALENMEVMTQGKKTPRSVKKKSITYIQEAASKNRQNDNDILKDAEEKISNACLEMGEIAEYCILTIEQMICFYDELTMLMIFDCATYGMEFGNKLMDEIGKNIQIVSELNKNRGKAYKIMEGHAEKILGPYLDGRISYRGKKNFFGALNDYMELICKPGKRNLSRDDIMRIRCTLICEWFSMTKNNPTKDE
jgi:hypothetical protein